MKAFSILGFGAALMLLTGCASDGTDYYLKDSFGFKEVCLVDNRNVPPSFFMSLRQALTDKGLKVITVNKPESDCQATVLYEATYNLAYLKDARLILLSEGHQTDMVTLRKVIEPAALADHLSDADPQIRDMVNRLLPRGTPW